MRTEFALLAVYNSPVIPLKDFVEREMSIKMQTARNQIAAGTFPIPHFTVSGKRMIHVADAAKYIDNLRESA